MQLAAHQAVGALGAPGVSVPQGKLGELPRKAWEKVSCCHPTPHSWAQSSLLQPPNPLNTQRGACSLPHIYFKEAGHSRGGRSGSGLALKTLDQSFVSGTSGLPSGP